MLCRRQTVTNRELGVTLVEMIVVIAISAILAGAVAVFIKRPFEAYIDAERRAELSDIADTALRRMTRDVRGALPNSIRITEFPAASGILYLEYLQTSGGGRYRAELDNGGGGNILDFTATDLSFDVIGTMPTFAGGESIVIYNVASSGSTANAYTGDNRAGYSSNAANVISLTSAKQFPFASPGKRFHVVQYAVTYACNPTTGELRRYWNYGFVDPQPTPPATANNALLATDIAGCSFSYDATGAGLRTGVLMLTLRVARNGESVRLFQQVHVNNVP
jgi:MSHA biogenesis protein MshO